MRTFWKEKPVQGVSLSSCWIPLPALTYLLNSGLNTFVGPTQTDDATAVHSRVPLTDSLCCCLEEKRRSVESSQAKILLLGYNSTQWKLKSCVRVRSYSGKVHIFYSKKDINTDSLGERLLQNGILHLEKFHYINILKCLLVTVDQNLLWNTVFIFTAH